MVSCLLQSSGLLLGEDSATTCEMTATCFNLASSQLTDEGQTEFLAAVASLRWRPLVPWATDPMLAGMAMADKPKSPSNRRNCSISGGSYYRALVPCSSSRITRFVI